MAKSVSFKTVVLVTIFALVGVSSVHAQAFRPIFSANLLTNMSWSTDGRLSFQEGDSRMSTTPDAPWYEYYPTAQLLATTIIWPRQPTLSADELALYEPLRNDQGVISYIFASPNGRYLVFFSRVGGTWIADRQRTEMAETYTRAGDFGYGLRDFNVIWNQTGNAFVVMDGGDGYGGILANVAGYVTNFTDNINDLTATSRDDMNLTVEGTEWYPTEFYGLSDDGKHLLFMAIAIRPSDRQAYRLMRWNADTNTATLIDTFDGNFVRAAMFEDGDTDRLVVLSNLGISRYTISNGYHRILNTQFDIENIIEAKFSYDGRWLAVSGGDGLFVFDLDNDFIGLKAQHYADVTARLDETESLFPHFNVVNDSDWPVDLSKVKLRYYFSAESDAPIFAACEDAALWRGCEDVTVKVTPPDNVSDYAYIEVGFTRGELSGHGQTGDISVRAYKQDYSDFHQFGDYSFNRLNATNDFVDQLGIPVYYDGKLVWGREPR